LTGRSTLGRHRHALDAGDRKEVAMEERTRTPEHPAEALERLLGHVREAMTTSPVSLEPGLHVADATNILESHHVAGAPVVESGRVVGIVTRDDLRLHRARNQRTGPFLRPVHGREEPRVADLMRRSVVVAAPDEPLLRAVERMAEEGVDRLPVVDEARRPIGILARDDVIRALGGVARRAREPRSRRSVLLPD
jgi:CBS domain-containing protein